MELQDRMSGPAAAMARRLDAVAKATASLKKATAALNRETQQSTGAMGLFDRRAAGLARGAVGRNLENTVRTLGPRLRRELGSSTSSVGEMSSGLSAMGGVALGVAAAATAAAMAIAGIGVSAGRSVLELAAFQESNMGTMTTLLGSRGAADREFSDAARIARMTPLDTRDVISTRTSLLSAGFSDTRERDVLMAGLADLSALTPGDSGILGRGTLALGQIRGAGRLRGQDLNQMLNVGLSRDRLFTELAPLLGIHGTGAAANRQVNQAMEHGRITDTMFFSAMTRAIQRQTHTSQIGEFSGSKGQEITSLLSTLASSVPELVMGGGNSGISTLFESPGLKAFKGFLTDVIALLGPLTPTGKLFQKVMRDLIDDVGRLFGTFKRDELASIFMQALGAIQWVIGAVKTLFKLGQALGGGYFEVMGPVFTVIGQAAMAMMKQFSGADSEHAMTALRGIGILLGLMVAPIVILGAIATAVILGMGFLFGWLATVIGDAASWIADHLDDIGQYFVDLWNKIPQPLKDFFEWLTSPAIAFDFNVSGGDLSPAVNRTVNDGLARGASTKSTVNNTNNIVLNAPGATPEGAQALAGAVGAVLDTHGGDR